MTTTDHQLHESEVRRLKAESLLDEATQFLRWADDEAAEDLDLRIQQFLDHGEDDAP